MVLKLSCEGDVIEVIVSIYGGSESIIVFFLDEKSIESFVDSSVIVRLDSLEVGLHESEMLLLVEELNSPRVIKSRRQNGEEIIQKKRLVFYVELHCFVVQLHVSHLKWIVFSSALPFPTLSHLGNDFLEVLLSPRLRGMSHHREGSVIVLFVLVIQEDKLRPQMSLFSSTENLKEAGVNEKRRMVVPWECSLYSRRAQDVLSSSLACTCCREWRAQ